MLKIDAIIVDDEGKNVKLLDHFIQKYCPQINIVGTALTNEEAVEKIDALKPHLIFMDIVLDEGTAFDVLDKINHSQYKLIFITSYSEYAVRAFKHNAIDYILKPVSIEDLILAVNKAYEDIEREWFTSKEQIFNLTGTIENRAPFRFIAVPSMDKIEFVKIEDILYLNSDGRYTIFYLSNGNKIMASKNLGEFENIIDKTQFFRIHNSYIVNLQHIKKINKTDGSYCEMSNNESLPIAKRRQESLNKFLRIK